MKYRYQTIATLLALTLTLSGTALAAETPSAEIAAPNTIESVATQPNNLVTTGTIATVGETTSNSGYQILIDDALMVNLPAENQAPIYDVRNGVSTLTAEQLEEGMHIAVLYGSNTPMTLSLPPQISQIKALVVMPEDMSTVVDTFSPVESGAYINSTATLVLHVNDDTSIYDANGETVTPEEFAADNAAERDAQSEYAVFYSAATLSLPPQASPVLMLELDTPAPQTEETAAEPTEASETTETSLEMLPLRTAAEAAGYTVQWNGDNQVILMSQNTVSFTLTIGQQQAGYNKSLIQLDAAPELRDGITYVPASFLQLMMQALEG